MWHSVGGGVALDVSDGRALLVVKQSKILLELLDT